MDTSSQERKLIYRVSFSFKTDLFVGLPIVDEANPGDKYFLKTHHGSFLLCEETEIHLYYSTAAFNCGMGPRLLTQLTYASNSSISNTYNYVLRGKN